MLVLQDLEHKWFSAASAWNQRGSFKVPAQAQPIKSDPLGALAVGVGSL